MASLQRQPGQLAAAQLPALPEDAAARQRVLEGALDFFEPREVRDARWACEATVAARLMASAAVAGALSRHVAAEAMAGGPVQPKGEEAAAAAAAENEQAPLLP